MALSRVKTWIAGEVLTASDLNAEFNNLLNNARDLVSPLTGVLDMNGFELIMDGDADSSLTADTDDRIDVRLGGVDLFFLDGTTASSVNGLTFTSAATGVAPVIAASGETNVGLRLASKGTGELRLETNSSEALRVDTSQRILVGHTASITTGAAATAQLVGTSAAFSSILRFSADTGAPGLLLAKSRSGTKGTNTVVQSDDDLGSLNFYGADGTDYALGAQIKASVDTTPGNNDMPGRLILATSADGAETPVERLRIDSTGLITIASGQIKFPATQNAAADVNTLDDYEEGTWTPSLGGSTTYTTQVGKYTKVGNLVTVKGQIVVNNIGTGSTGVISGLPFAAAAGFSQDASVGFFAGSATNYTWIGGFVTAATSAITLVSTAAAAASVTNPATVFGNGTNIVFSMTYVT